jgi:hypothetical protein
MCTTRTGKSFTQNCSRQTIINISEKFIWKIFWWTVAERNEPTSERQKKKGIMGTSESHL